MKTESLKGLPELTARSRKQIWRVAEQARLRLNRAQRQCLIDDEFRSDSGGRRLDTDAASRISIDYAHAYFQAICDVYLVLRRPYRRLSNLLTTAMKFVYGETKARWKGLGFDDRMSLESTCLPKVRTALLDRRDQLLGESIDPRKPKGSPGRPRRTVSAAKAGRLEKLQSKILSIRKIDHASRPRRQLPLSKPSIEKPDFWRARRTDFDGLLARQRSILGQETREEWLKAHCDFSSEHGEFGRCQLRGGFDGRLISDFEDIATQAANALGCPPGVDPTAFWLYNLAKDLLKASKRQIRREFSPGGEWGGYIQGLLESSAGYCSRLAAKADRQGIDNAGKPDESLGSNMPSLTQWDIASAESTGPPTKVSESKSDALSGETLPARPVGVARALSGSPVFGAITRRSTRAIKLGFASNQVADIVVPKMTYEFPAYFPETARRKVLAARLRAEDALKEKRGGVTEFEIAEGLVCEFILEVFKAFVEEGHKLGMREFLTAAQLESECLNFLYSYSVQAGLFDGNLIALSVKEVPGDVLPQIERSEQWRRYRQLLQEVADAQAYDEPSLSTVQQQVVAGTGDRPQTRSLSPRDAGIHDIIGERNFTTLRNAEIMNDRTIRKQLPQAFKVRGTGDALKSCLDRIRRAKGYPLSKQIAKRRSTPK